jgi:hypothetical protein
MFGKKKEDSKVILGNLVEGLPVHEGIDLIIKMTPDGASIMIPSSKQTFEINISKLTSVEYYSETDMKQIISQSAPGMIIGAAAFGILGAMVGGRVKTKEKKVVTHFAVINYESDSQKQIVIQTNDFFGAGQFVDYFKTLKPCLEPRSISL